MITANTTEDQLEYSATLGWQPVSCPLPEYDDTDHPPGYTLTHWLGDSDSIRFFEADEPSPYMYLVAVSPLTSFRLDVFVRSIPDLLGLLAVLQPLMALEAIEQQAEIAAIARKLFRALHGHDSRGVCHDCDPDEMRRRAAARQQQQRGAK